MIPMLRNLLSGACLAIKPLYIYQPPRGTPHEPIVASSPSICTSALPFRLPAIVRERLVGLGHTMHVLAFLDRIPFASGGVHDLGGEFVNHSLLAPITRVRHQPAHRQGDAAAGADLDRDLIVGAADALRFDLDLRLEVLNRLLEDLQRVFLRSLFDLVKSLVDDALGHRFLAVPHHRVDEFGDERAVIYRVRQNFAFWDFSSSRHMTISSWPLP